MTIVVRVIGGAMFLTGFLMVAYLYLTGTSPTVLWQAGCQRLRPKGETV